MSECELALWNLWVREYGVAGAHRLCHVHGVKPRQQFVLVSLERLRSGVMYWRPNHGGYTASLVDAGLYSADEFAEIERRSPGDSVAVPFAVALAIATHAANAIAVCHNSDDDLRGLER